MLRTGKTVRIYHDDAYGWWIRDILNHRNLRTDKLTAAVAIAFLTPSEPHKVVDALSSCVSEAAIHGRIEALVKYKILLDPEKPDGHHLLDKFSQWTKYGWGGIPRLYPCYMVLPI